MLMLPYSIDDVIFVKGTVKKIFIDDDNTTYRIAFEKNNGEVKTIDLNTSVITNDYPGGIKPVANIIPKDSEVPYTYGDRARIHKPGTLKHGQCATIVGYRKVKTYNEEYLSFRVAWSDGDQMLWVTERELTRGWDWEDEA